MKKKLIYTLVLTVAVLCAQRQRRTETPPETPAQAQTGAPAPPQKPAVPLEEKISTTEHTTHIGGHEIKYTATAGTMAGTATHTQSPG